MARIILMEVTPRDPSDNSIKTVHLASIDAQSLFSLNDGITDWQPVVIDWPSPSLSLTSSGEFTTPSSDHGSIGFDITNNRVWLTYQWVNAQASVWIGNDGDAFTAFELIFAGPVGALEAEAGLGRLQLLGRDRALKVNLLSASYAGTGSAEGTAELKGTLKPWASGRCLNVTPILIAPAYNIYQYHGYGTTDAVEAVYEAALTLGSPTATYTTYSALAGASLSAGQWAAAPAIGMFRLGGNAKGLITADIRGSLNGSTYVSTLSTIAQHLLAVAGISSSYIDVSSFSPFTQTWCAYVRDQVELGDFLRDAFAQVGAYILSSNSGRFFVGDFYGTKTPVALNEDGSSAIHVLRTALRSSAQPAYKVNIKHTRSWTVQSTSEISPIIASIGETNASQDAAIIAAQTAANLAQASATTITAEITAQATDSILSRAEKANLIFTVGSFATEKTPLENQATSLGVTTEKTAYTAAYNAMTTYLGGLSPAWNDTTAQTTIVPADYTTAIRGYLDAKVTLFNAIAAKTALLANWASITGSGKPSDFATLNLDGQNMIPDPLNYTGGALLNGAVYATLNSTGRPVERRSIQLAFGANALGQFGPKMPAIPGETLYLQYTVKSDGGASETCNASVAYYDAAGNGLGAINLGGSPYNTARALSSVSSAWTVVQTSFVVPSTAAYVLVYVERPFSSGYSFFLGEPFLGRAQPGSTIGAPAGTNVGSIGASAVSSTINGGGGVAAGNVSTSSLQNNSVSGVLTSRSGTTWYGNGTWQTLIIGSLSLATAGQIYISFTGSHSYTSGQIGWGIRIRLNGTIISANDHSSGAAGFTDSVCCSGSASVGSGSNSISVEWFGANATLTMWNDTTYSQGIMK